MIGFVPERIFNKRRLKVTTTSEKRVPKCHACTQDSSTTFFCSKCRQEVPICLYCIRRPLRFEFLACTLVTTTPPGTEKVQLAPGS